MQKQHNPMAHSCIYNRLFSLVILDVSSSSLVLLTLTTVTENASEDLPIANPQNRDIDNRQQGKGQKHVNAAGKTNLSVLSEFRWIDMAMKVLAQESVDSSRRLTEKGHATYRQLCSPLDSQNDAGEQMPGSCSLGFPVAL